MATTIDLKTIPTCELVEELESREGVTTDTVEPHERTLLPVDGPAVVLTVTE